MPIEDLLSMYYSHQQAAEGEGDSPNHPAMELHESRSSSEEEILSNQDLTLDKEEIARDLQLKNEDEHEGETSVTDLLDSVEMPSQTVRLLRCKLKPRKAFLGYFQSMSETKRRAFMILKMLKVCMCVFIHSQIH